MNQNNDLLLAVSDLSCDRGERRLLSDIHFSLYSGYVLHVRGPNGIGKSSLLRIIAGLLSPTLGKVQCHVDAFYLGHQLGLKPEFTVKENLLFDPRYSKPCIEMINAILSDMQLLSLLNERTGLLSQGQQQKLALAKCLFSSAKLWILDEPLVALDSEARSVWQKKMIDFVCQGGAVVISSHLPLSIAEAHYQTLDLL